MEGGGEEGRDQWKEREGVRERVSVLFIASLFLSPLSILLYFYFKL